MKKIEISQQTAQEIIETLKAINLAGHGKHGTDYLRQFVAYEMSGKLLNKLDVLINEQHSIHKKHGECSM